MSAERLSTRAFKNEEKKVENSIFYYSDKIMTNRAINNVNSAHEIKTNL